MILSKLYKVDHYDGSFQRFQVISGFSWDDLHYFYPRIDERTIEELVRLYNVNIIPKLLDNDDSFIFFCIPEDMDLPFCNDTDIGFIYDKNILFGHILSSSFKKGETYLRNGVLVSDDSSINNILKKLYEAHLIGYSANKGHQIKFIPVNRKMGFISKKQSDCTLNSHFFLMDPSDIDSPYCQIGTACGFSLENGEIRTPPLNHRCALFVDKDKHASIKNVELKQLTFVIDGRKYIPGENCILHIRPEERITPKITGSDIIITEDRVVAVKRGGESVIPVAGFVISTSDDISLIDTKVSYHGLENYHLAFQVGPAMVENGVMKDKLEIPFFDKSKDKVIYSPTVFPLPYESARAARICIGTDSSDNPVIVFAEGAGKLGIDKAHESTGASLLEMAEFCFSQNYKNIINLDGGGSANLIFNGRRDLKLADRLPVSNKECERPVSNGLFIG